MIVSASYNDDIPAYYGGWFMKRFDAGYCRTFDSQGLRFHRVMLTPEAVDAFVFWTRRARPFLACLRDIHSRGLPFVVQYGITTNEPDAISDVHEIAATYGACATVWRYEPIVVDAERTLEWHAENFHTLAGHLGGATDEVVLAFSDEPGADEDPATVGEKRVLLKRLAASAARFSIRASICSQPAYLVPGSSPARCIDAKRLSILAKRAISAETRGRWAGCLCAAVRDIGAPLTAPPPSRGAVLIPRRVNHDEDSEFLVPPATELPELGAEALPF